MTDAVTVSPLRQRMIEDMTIRRFGEHTQRDYVRQVREFTAFLGLPPDRAEPRICGAISFTWPRSAQAMPG
jgi:integrase/recombinase XerD